MKELSVEQKAQRYDEAIERAKGVIEQNPLMEYLKKGIEYIFPVLKESEDEEYLENIIGALNILISYIEDDATVPDAKAFLIEGIEKQIAWLEKQGEHEKFRDSIQVGDKVTRNEDGVLVNLSQLNRVAKPADKVEPKFNVGDWVVCNNGSHPIFQVIERSWPNAKYRDIKGTEIFLNVRTLDKQFHLWTIQDAKDGDVLADGNLPFIFKKIDANKYSYAYCGISVDDGFKIESDGESGEWTWMQDIKPATKEQRDLLFQKMHEAGYEWDAEKKELKKIEQKPAEWSDEDETGLANTIIMLKEGASLHFNKKDITKAVNWLKSLKDKVGCEAKCTTTKEWSKEDERIYQSIMDDTVQENQRDGKQTDWLRNIKYRNFARPQSTWKPSDNELEVLRLAAEKDGTCLMGLYEKLKKLREE